MSQTICMYNYEYNGHVYSPAFSEPPSPAATSDDNKTPTDSDAEEEQRETSSSPPPVVATSLLERLAPLSTSHHATYRPWAATSTGSSESYLKKRRLSSAHPYSQPIVNRKPRFPTKYHERLQPMEPLTTMPVATITPTHRSDHSESAQADFHSTLQKCLSEQKPLTDLEAYLTDNRDRIDVNQYMGDSGQTPLHLACMQGDVAVAKLLVRYGANPRLTTRDGFSCMHIAAFSGSADVMLYVMSLK